MKNRRDLLKTAILATGASLITGCASDEEVDDQYADVDHFAYDENKDYINSPDKNFNYHEFNNKDYEGQKRSEAGMNKHRPIVVISGNKQEFRITFDGGSAPHPHKAGHYWAWIEIADSEGNILFNDFPEPAKGDDFYGKDGTKFEAYLQSETPLKGWLRVRACCTPHGVFMDYIKNS